MQDVIRDINNILSATEFGSREIKQAKAILSNAQDALDLSLKMVDDEINMAPVNAVYQARDATLQEAPLIFTSEVLEAVAKNDEFSYHAFLEPLYAISNHDDLYSIVPHGHGWNAVASVTLNMDEVAGSIDDYAQAVEATRDALNVGKGDPVKASMIWRTKIYSKRGGSSMYGYTISQRLSSATTPAPFWSLLNNGNKVAMPSDRGGTAYPNRGGTHFVEEAEKRIAREFAFQMSNLRVLSELVVDRMMADIGELRSLIRKLRNLVDEVSRVPIETLEVVATKIDATADVLSANKVYKALSELKAGKFKERYDIGVEGGKRKRVRLKRLLQIAGGLPPIGE